MPLAVAGAVAAGSVTLLALAVSRGWLGPDVGRGAVFCEAARSGAVRQPANTASNAGFVVAGLAIAWRARRPELLGTTLPRYRGLTTALACLVVLLGPASGAMHATQSAWGGHLDMLSMYLVASFAAAYAGVRLARGGRGQFVVTFAALLAGCEAVGTISRPVPVVAFAGNVAFAALLLFAVAAELVLQGRDTRTDLRFGAAAVASMLVAFTIWNLGQHGWCDPHSWLQAHGVWHLLGALAAYWLFRLYASERPAPAR